MNSLFINRACVDDTCTLDCFPWVAEMSEMYESVYRIVGIFLGPAPGDRWYTLGLHVGCINKKCKNHCLGSFWDEE